MALALRAACGVRVCNSRVESGTGSANAVGSPLCGVRNDEAEELRFSALRETRRIPGSASAPESRASTHRAEARPRKVDPRRLAGDIQQHLRVGLVKADGGNLVPAEERRFAQPFGIGGDFLQRETV